MDLTPLNAPWAAVDSTVVPGRVDILDCNGRLVARCFDDDHADRIVVAVNALAENPRPC